MTQPIPTIHLNGTSKESLLEGHEKVLRALTSALDAMREIAPHGRDYYVQMNPNAWKDANYHHLLRLKAIQDVKDELLEIYDAIDKQGR